MATAVAVVIGLAALAILILRVSHPLPSLAGRIASSAVIPGSDGLVGRFVDALSKQNPGKSGIFPLLNAKEAFAARMLLARAAKHSIDAQYYIWHDDLSGRALFVALVQAADRGVRVRLLLDDNNTAGMDPLLAAIDRHPNIEVRLFNPFMQRSARIFGYLSDFFRLNRRMHNKSFTVDNQATIIGGRNIGDEYFDLSPELAFVDTDVLTLGPAAHETSRQFDHYWASKSSYPTDIVVTETQLTSLADLFARVERDSLTDKAKAYRTAVEVTDLVEQLQHGSLALEWASVRLFYDDPAKGLGKAKVKLLIQELASTTEPPSKSLDVVSAYFVPGRKGRKYFLEQARRGVAVRICTNSQQATDVPPVHAGYIKYRRDLLEAGVELRELKSMAMGQTSAKRLSGSSSSSLHSKMMVFDRKRIFIGSFNFDPRSAWLNCELGLLVESPSLARNIAERVDHADPYTYRPAIGPNGDLRWSDVDCPGQDWEVEPNTSLGSRIAVKAISVLPIEWLL